MSPLTILSIFVLLVVLLIVFEYMNERKYQKERRERRRKTIPDQRKTSSQKQKRSEPKPKTEPKPKIEPEAQPVPEAKIELEPEPRTEALKETKKLPEANYPKFTHSRLVEMGLSDEEAKEFVGELIPQIETHYPLIEKAIQESDFEQLERLTHGIKGSASNLGTGGVSDLLNDYNTYLKTGTDLDVIHAYFAHLKHYNDELKAQYS
ncbi:MAG TPA: Hpt domain-containing protein [Sulfurovum sp.]|uniref:Hpt domain-containing protein n=1 Tax=Sulfurovum sp. TaxID=1969726 RepID=UPI002F92A4F8